MQLTQAVVCMHSSIRGLIPKLLQDMLDGVEGVDEDNQRKAMFSQWLKPQPGATAGNCDETYCIVESLLTVSYTTQTESAASSMPLWQRSDIDAMGSMKVIRVSDVKTGGRLFNTLLHAFLKFTARPGAKGPAWSGLVSKDNSSSHSKASWQLFAVIKDFSQDEASKKLEHNIPTWFRQRRLCSSHPCLKTPIQVMSCHTCVCTVICAVASLAQLVCASASSLVSPCLSEAFTFRPHDMKHTASFVWRLQSLPHHSFMCDLVYTLC